MWGSCGCGRGRYCWRCVGSCGVVGGCVVWEDHRGGWLDHGKAGEVFWAGEVVRQGKVFRLSPGSPFVAVQVPGSSETKVKT